MDMTKMKKTMMMIKMVVADVREGDGEEDDAGPCRCRL